MRELREPKTTLKDLIDWMHTHEAGPFALDQVVEVHRCDNGWGWTYNTHMMFTSDLDIRAVLKIRRKQ